MILLGTHDAGPAKYLCEIASALQETTLCAGSAVSLPVFESYGLSATDGFYGSNEKLDLIVTGTCLGEGLDKQLVRLGKEQGVPVVSVIEHWSWYRKRFETDEGLLLPDWILLNDSFAKESAIQDGLPEEKLVIAGNPVLEKMLTEPAEVLPRAEWLHMHNLPDRDYIVFVSEELRSDFPQGTPSYPGYDEYSVLEDLIACAGGKDVLIKLHPAERADKYSAYLSGTVHCIAKTSVSSMAVHAFAVVGMASMLLLELAFIRKDIISHRPGAVHSFIGEGLGATTPSRSREMLSGLLLGKDSPAGAFDTKRFIGSAARCVQLLRRIIDENRRINSGPAWLHPSPR